MSSLGTTLPEAVSLDLDRTISALTPQLFQEALGELLSESALESLRARQRELLRAGDPLAYDWSTLSGRDVAGAYRRALGRRRAELAAEGMRLRGLLRYLESHQIPVFLATDGYLAFQSEALKALGLLESLSGLVSPEATGCLKRDPRFWKEFPEGTLHAGDSPLSDVQGPLAAGLRAVWVGPGGRPGYLATWERERSELAVSSPGKSAPGEAAAYLDDLAQLEAPLRAAEAQSAS